MNVEQTTTITAHGIAFRVDVITEEGADAPWHRMDPLGTLRDSFSYWTRPHKAPGERLLASHRGHHRFYDFAGAVAAGRARGMTGPDAAHAATWEFDYFRRWLDDGWHFVGVVVTNIKPDGSEGASDSLWGIESDATEHLSATALDMAAHMAEGIQKEADEALAWAERDVVTTGA